MVFENGVKDIQAAAYNGTRTVLYISIQSNNFEYLVYLIFKGRNFSKISFVYWAMR